MPGERRKTSAAGLLHGESHEDIEVLPGDTQVRITVSVDATLPEATAGNASEDTVATTAPAGPA